MYAVTRGETPSRLVHQCTERAQTPKYELTLTVPKRRHGYIHGYTVPVKQVAQQARKKNHVRGVTPFNHQVYHGYTSNLIR